MKEELLKVLNIKLKYLNDNIDALNRMNASLERENNGLDYIRSVLRLLEVTEGEYSVYNFSKLKKDNFEKIMTELDEEVSKKFENENCNYEGLIYLINGINNGISLKLTDEQIHAIEFMIDAIVNLQMAYLARIDGILLARSSLEISDLDVLTGIKEKYDNIVNKLAIGDYVDEIDEIIDSINYSRVDNEKTIDILSYLLQYNSEIYNQKRVASPKNEVKEQVSEEPKVEEIDLSKPFMVEENESVQIPIFEENEPFNNLTFNNFENIKSFEEETKDLEEKEVSEYRESEMEENIPFEEYDIPSEEEFDELPLPEVDFEEETETMVDEDFKDLLETDESYVEEGPVEEEQFPEESEENDYSQLEEGQSNDFEEVNEKTSESFEENEVSNENEVKSLFEEYKIRYSELSEENKKVLSEGNLDNYKNILVYLKEKDLLSTYEKNFNLLVNTLVYSDIDTIEEVLAIIEKELSVDREDREVTTNIVISALPSVFVKEPYGNYETFVKNVKTLKSLGVDLINLFDFSREMFVINNEVMVNNEKIVRSYELTVNDKNAKYLLVLPNIAEKLDYYVEAVTVDTMKNGAGKTFDGAEYIKLYPNKLNTVNDTTIKRLRYSSENGRKIFGAKENSLAGEITNLKVDVLNINDEYLRNYFNNEFDIISRDEALRYEKLIQEETDYNMELDEILKNLNPYLEGLRYNIDGVNISRNKLIRNYNILVKNGVDKLNALIYAACHNAIITKEEYQKVKNTLSNVGGR